MNSLLRLVVRRCRYFFFTILINYEYDGGTFYFRLLQVTTYVKGDVRGVKMWRKDDFDRLVDKARKLGIVVEPKET